MVFDLRTEVEVLRQGLFFLVVCQCADVCVHSQSVQIDGVNSLLPQCGSHRWNSSHQDWQQAPLLTESS